MKITFLRPNHMHRSLGRSALLLISLALACFGLSPQARADCQEGCDLINANTFLGEDALLDHSGISNTAVGWHALMNTANTISNTGIGSAALENNGSYDNTAIGAAALRANTGGHDNTATGFSALWSNTTGIDNTATGADALLRNTTGNFNVANGMWALSGNKTGAKNTAMGYTALGGNATGSLNIALGFGAGGNLTTGNDNIDIGNPGVAGEGRTIRIGAMQSATFIAGISGATVPTGVPVIVDSTGHLGTTTSSARYKDNIHPMDKASEAILALKPVTFRYKHDLDPARIPQFGLVAEDVERVNPDLVARDEQGKPYTVRYEAVNAMLLNEFLKEHKKVEEQQATIAELKSTVAQQQKGFQSRLAEQQKQIEALTAGLQEVKAQVATSRLTPQTVVTNR
jgi:hypothetical protein